MLWRETISVEGAMLKPSIRAQDSQQYQSCHGDLAVRLGVGLVPETHGAGIRKAMLLYLTAALFAVQPGMARSQALAISGDSSVNTASTTPAKLDLDYERPTQRTMAGNYVFDAFGPYPIAGSAMAAGIGQFSNAPPEWNQGLKGYSRRFGSDFGIVAVGTTTRYALSEALKQGALPRLRHALISTLTARRGEDGHRVFSFSALAAPYAGSFTAVYGWYPDRFGAKDAFRIGNYSLLSYAGGNVALEFFYSGPHSLLSRMHLSNAHGAPDPGPNH